MRIKLLLKNRGFITLSPAIIVTALLFVLTVQANFESLVSVYELNTTLGKMQSNRAVDSCFINVQYKILQESLVATSSYADTSGDSRCLGSITGQGSYVVELSSQIFGATSSHRATIGTNNTVSNEQKN